MKHVFLLVAMLVVPGMASAQSVLSGLLNKVTGSEASSTIANAVTSILGSKKVSQSTLVGTWSYESPAIVFESDDIANKLGGSLLSSKGEELMSTQLKKLGVQPGKVVVTFNSDSTYTCKLGSKTTKGKYSVKDATLTLTKLGFTTMKTNVKVTGKEMQLAVEADKLLSLVSSFGNVAGSVSGLSSLTSFIKGYDGMQVGMKFQKN